MSWYWAILRSLSFLSRLPVGNRPFDNLPQNWSVADDAWAFPLTGFILALPGASIFWLAAAFDLPALPVSVLACAFTMLLTGALHEDGLADVADGFGGGSKKERRLEIMKDSSIGTYGALALIIGFLVIATSTAHLIGTSGAAAGTIFIAVHVASRSIMVWHWHALPAAKGEGVASQAGQPSAKGAWYALVTGGPLTALLIGVATQFALLPLIIATLIGAAISKSFSRLTLKLLGGHTGDTIGASQQLSLAALMCALAMTV
ncbi:MAG: adenosylcobinamide-GDP ribazoletransferase [Pseudomonadota bacterium]